MVEFQTSQKKELSLEQTEEERKNEIFLKNMLKRMENKDKYI